MSQDISRGRTLRELRTADTGRDKASPKKKQSTGTSNLFMTITAERLVEIARNAQECGEDWLVLEEGW